jgi:hypothetical protein
MTDVRSIFKDMVRQRRVQAATALLAVAGIALWLAGNTLGMYLAAAAIILFTVATLRWIDDEEIIEEEQLQHKDTKDTSGATDAAEPFRPAGKTH